MSSSAHDRGSLISSAVFAFLRLVKLARRLLRRFIESIRPLLRACGLASVGFVTHISRKKSPAHGRRIYDVKPWINFQRCLVHLLPSCVSFIAIYLNVMKFFIGFELAGVPGSDDTYLAALQIAAKCQELLVIGSIGTIVCGQIRHDLISRKGIPFGLVGSGISFTQLSYLWSPDFLWSILSNPCKKKIWKKSYWKNLWRNNNLFLIFLIVAGCIMSSVAGPATAVLIIPRVVSMNIDTVDYYVDGSSADLWPSDITMNYYLLNYANSNNESMNCSKQDGYRSGICPSGGYSSLFAHFDAGNAVTRAGIAKPAYDNTDVNTQSTRGDILINSPGGQVVPHAAFAKLRNEAATLLTFTTATHAATANHQHVINRKWEHSAQGTFDRYPIYQQRSRYRFYALQRSTVKSKIPWVLMYCLPGKFIPVNTTRLSFPSMLPGSEADPREADVPEFPTTYNASKPLSMTYHSVSLPDAGFVSTGLSFRVPVNDSMALVSTCSVDARWCDAEITVQYPGPSESYILPGGYFYPVSVDRAWLDVVNFALPEGSPGYQPWGITALEAMAAASIVTTNFTDALYNRMNLVEYAVTASLADAMSRLSSHRSYDTSGRIGTWPLVYYNNSETPNDIANWKNVLPPTADTAGSYTKFTAVQSITGYALAISGRSDWLAVAVLATHLLAALAHTVYVLCVTRRTSGCWDTVCEIVALAQQSRPTREALVGTGAGIADPWAFRRKVRLRRVREVARDEEEGVVEAVAVADEVAEGTGGEGDRTSREGRRTSGEAERADGEAERTSREALGTSEGTHGTSDGTNGEEGGLVRVVGGEKVASASSSRLEFVFDEGSDWDNGDGLVDKKAKYL